MEKKYIDGLMGFVVGDAMGVPLETKSREYLLNNPVTKMTGNGSHNVPEGTWSDDTSMLIATIDSINVKCAIDFRDIADKFLLWKNHSDYTPNKELFGIGNNIKRALEKYEKNRELDPTECGVDEEEACSNGSLMRIIPIAYYAIEKKLKDFEVLELVKQLSSITHRNETCIMACYFYVRLVMFLLNDKDKYSAYSMTKCVDYSMFTDETQDKFSRLIKEDVGKLNVDQIKSSSYVVDTLEAAIWVMLKSENFKEAIIGAVNLGGDTDTIGALTGALAGIIYGYDSIPESWLDKIARKEYLLDIFEEFSENKYK